MPTVVYAVTMEPMTPSLDGTDPYDRLATENAYDGATLPPDAPDTISTGTGDTYGAAVRTHEPVDQRLANYRPADSIDASCAVCVHYHADDAACFRVAGSIRPDYQCDLFQLATLAERASETAVLDGAYIIAKSDDEQQIVFGWANVAVTKTGEQTIDHHLDVIEPEDLEAAAYDFVLNARASGEDHAGEVDAECVESIVFTAAKAEAMGIPPGIVPEAGWWVGFHIADRDAYLRAKTEKRMFSIEGTAVREPIAKREFTTDQRRAMASEGTALPDGSFPIANVGDLRNAIAAYGRAKNRAAAKAHIVKRARALDATNLLPDGWG